MNEIDQYIQDCEKEIQPRLQELRDYIKQYASNATEKMSWQMPTFYLNGNLVHFALHKNHIGFYPGEDGVKYFEERLKNFKHSKGAIQLPHNEPLPLELIRDIVVFRVQQNENLDKKK